MLRILRYEDIPVLSEWALNAILYIFLSRGRAEGDLTFKREGITTIEVESGVVCPQQRNNNF